MTDPMSETAILARLSQILSDVLEDPAIELGMQTTRPEVPRWDSFAYITFIVGVETEFGIKFPLAQVESFQTVGDIVREIRVLKG